ncbi:glycosyltransferase family 2 protein [Candidatus Roizmanbacteria bacterium]|nr:glycosyltransferase family 2 protein [Candidatus Roizmanbacteria bacterium]
MVKKTVSLIIPNYNGAKLLAKNLPKVLAAANYYSQNTEIIVVDDGSTDDSKEILNNFPKVTVIAKKKNEGFSSACNLGVAKANGDIVVLLNTDVWPEENFLNFLVPHFTNTKVFGVGCLDKSLENGKEVNRGRGIGWFKKGFLVHARGEVDKTNTLWVSGGSSAYSRKLFMELGSFDELYNPFYWEDIDLSYRAQKKGYQIIFEPKAIIHHQHESGAIKSKFSEKQVKNIAYRNQFIFVWKNITDGEFLLQHLIWLPWYLLRATLTGDINFLKGFVSALIKLPQIILSKPYKCISDKEILAPYQDET